MRNADQQQLNVIGGGLAGALLAGLLARRGLPVTVFERRADPRLGPGGGGRSINLALAERGLAALRRAGMDKEVLDNAVMMRGRCVHALDGSTRLLRYGRDDTEVIWSINRDRLNGVLLDFAQRSGARIEFGQRLGSMDFARDRMQMVGETDGTVRELPCAIAFACDGAGSAVRQAMGTAVELHERFESLGHGYKELEIPPLPGGGFRLEANALHIWPRGNYMAIALPNTEGSFTVTLFLPSEGAEPSFETVRTPTDARALFARDFADALPLMPELEEDFQRNPVGMLATLRVGKWHLGGEALLVGDAAHPILPFHGQGMNCAFEDCAELDSLIDAYPEWPQRFEAFEARRKPNANAIADMAIENYLEMRDRVDDDDFLRAREVETLLAERFPERFVPRYGLVTFRLIPYAEAQERGRIQANIIAELVAAAGAENTESIDIDHARLLVEQRLPPLPV